MKKKRILYMAATLCLVAAVTVVGVLAITSGTQTTGFNVTYTVSQVQATITLTGNTVGNLTKTEGAGDSIAITDGVTTITTATTDSTILAPTINGDEAVAFVLDATNNPQDIVFVFEITNNGPKTFTTELTCAPTLTNCTMSIYTGSALADTDAYASGTVSAALAEDATVFYVVVFSIDDASVNGSAAGDFVLELA